MRANTLSPITMETDELTVGNESVQSFDSLLRKNLIINGDFSISQRGSSPWTSGTTEWTLDRWQKQNSGNTYTMSRGTYLSAGSYVVDWPQPRYYTSHAVTGVAGASNYSLLNHKIEDVRRSDGVTMTFSFWGASGAGASVAVEGYQHFGSGGSATVYSLGVSKFPLVVGVWTRYEVTITYPTVQPKTIGSGSYFGVLIWFSSGSDYDARNDSLGTQSDTFYLLNMQMEKGVGATDFEYRSQQEELALCQRYFEKSYSQNINPGSISSQGMEWEYGNITGSYTTAGSSAKFRVEKRSAPSVTAYSDLDGAVAKAHDWGNGVNVNVTVTSVGTTGFYWYCAISAISSKSVSIQWIADAEL
jgi:hypothetical protein